MCAGVSILPSKGITKLWSMTRSTVECVKSVITEIVILYAMLLSSEVLDRLWKGRTASVTRGERTLAVGEAALWL